jgi:hypothetical protein
MRASQISLGRAIRRAELLEIEDVSASRSLAIRLRLQAAITLARERHPDRYDWGRVGCGDGSPETLKADEAEAALEDRIAEFLTNGQEAGIGAAFNAWLKALEV